MLLVLVSTTWLLVSVVGGGPVLPDNLTIGSCFQDMVVGFHVVLVGPGFQDIVVVVVVVFCCFWHYMFLRKCLDMVP